MKQEAIAAGDFERYRKPTRREKFLAEMDSVVPWAQLCEVIEPFYPVAGNGRPPIDLERMLRIYFLQHWFNLSDAERLRNRTRSKVRAEVEHGFGVMKRVFGCAKARYRGLAKRAHALFVLSALNNLYIARRRLRHLALD
jgi:hypothetical protein